ncbi:hypothetical protein Hdeb2414_s0006g00223461 [Helianthus debilis subsp. tardiflorus]
MSNTTQYFQLPFKCKILTFSTSVNSFDCNNHTFIHDNSVHGPKPTGPNHVFIGKGLEHLDNLT